MFHFSFHLLTYLWQSILQERRGTHGGVKETHWEHLSVVVWSKVV
ncbi:hypothetical protein DsansV1_C16g0142921 [Dioscorea sansibarensis]